MGARKLEEITATFCEELRRWGETALLLFSPANTNGKLSFDDAAAAHEVKLDCEPDELTIGLSYRLYGRWNQHPKYGPQFHAETYIRCEPHGRAGIIRYLMQAPNIGQVRAEKLWGKFGSQAVQIVREQPAVAAAAVEGLTEERAQAAARWLESERELEGCTIDLMDLLGGRGFPKSTARRATREWGNAAANVIKRSPYRLMRFRGCGFLRCDQLYLDMGGDPARLKRQSLCAWYALARDTNGDTWFPRETIEAGIRGKVRGTSLRPAEAAKLAIRAGMLAKRRDEYGKLWFALEKHAEQERQIAERIADLCGAHSPVAVRWPDVADLDVSDHQRQELAKALVSPVCVFGGSPGTGKTYSLARVVAAVMAEHGAESLAVCAPTGKAAVRITQAMQGYGINIRATTIHRLLGVAQRDDHDGWGFEHGEDDPLPQKFLFVDETSMVDTSLMAALLRATSAGAHLLFVGDINQLPPVGHGAPLRDLIRAGVAYGELREIHRNAGTIVRACHQIRDGHRFSVDERIDLEAGKNLRFLETKDAKATAETLLETLRKIRAGKLADVVWDCQVIVPLNDKGDLCRKKLNKLLQGELNPTGRTVAGIPFRTGDKIVCTKNGWSLTAESDDPTANVEQNDGKVFIANGELGRVEAVESTHIVAFFDAPKRLVRLYKSKAGAATEDDAGDSTDNSGSGGEENDKDTGAAGFSSFDLGFAISVHKSQGAEWPIVILIVDENGRRVMKREAIYTGISRAKSVCILIGKRAVADSFCMSLALPRRKTFLAEQIKEAMAAIPEPVSV